MAAQDSASKTGYTARSEGMELLAMYGDLSIAESFCDENVSLNTSHRYASCELNVTFSKCPLYIRIRPLAVNSFSFIHESCCNAVK